MADGKNTFRDNLLRVVAVLGLLAVLLLGAWGIIQIGFVISGLFNTGDGDASTPAPSAHELLTISVPSSAIAGQSVVVSWKHQGGTGAYAYGIIYSCVAGLSFKAPTPTGSLQSVECNKPFDFLQATSSMSITPVYSGSADAHATITVIATELSTGTTTASASASLTVSGTGTTAKPAASSGAASKPAATYVASGRTTGLYGSANLAVRITSVRSNNGASYAEFTVQNTGTNVAPAGWSFNAVIPLNGSYTYPSGGQRALYPGDYIVYTLAWGGSNTPYYPNCVGYSYGCITSPTYGQQMVSITVDPQNRVVESSEADNYASAVYQAY